MSKMKQVPIMITDDLHKLAKDRAAERAETFAAYMRRLIIEDGYVAHLSCDKCGGNSFYKRSLSNGAVFHACGTCHPLNKG